MVKSELEQIPGIGASSIQDLLRAFKSVAHIKDKNKKELAEIVGESRAKKIWTYFK